MRELTFQDLMVGQVECHTYKITPRVYDCFVSVFGDISPVHVSEAAARAAGFEEKVMHGAILNGFLSHFVGVHFPGKHSLLHSTAVQYKQPCFLNDSLLVEGTVVQKVEAVRVVIMIADVRNVSRDYLAAKAKLQIGLRC